MEEISRNTHGGGKESHTSDDASNDYLTGTARIENTDYVTGVKIETPEGVYGIDYVIVSNDPEEQRQINEAHASNLVTDQENHQQEGDN